MAVNLNKEQSLIDDAWRIGLAIPLDLTINKWADKNRFLSTKEARLHGPWETSNAPWTKEIMECLSPSHPCQRVVFMKGAQVAATDIIMNAIGYAIDQNPGPLLLVLPTRELASHVSIQRLKAMIENSPAVNAKIAPEKSRDSSNTIMRKEFLGGILILAAANSEAGLRSMPMRDVFLDEIDLYPGYTIPKAEKRTVTFVPYRKIYLTSTPKNKQSSIIANEYMLSDQRKYNISCPQCGIYQVLVWNNIKFEHDDNYSLAAEVTYACMGCGDHISQHKMLDDLESRAKWIPENQENGKNPGFHLSQLYSSLGSASWQVAVEEFLKFTKLKKEKNPMFLDLQETWTNDVLGEVWDEPAGDSTDWEVLYNRREDYNTELINENILAILCGVDVQGDRIEAKIIGVGLNYQIWVLEYKYLYGKLTDPALWAHLDQFLLKTYNHPNGKMRILGTAIDTGYHPDEVCEFVRTRYVPGKRYVFGIKGSSLYHQPIVSAPSKNRGILLFSVGTDTAKDKIDTLLKVAEPGPGYVHFSLSLPKQYFEQLCAEKKKKEWKPKLRKYMNVWRNPNKARNEAQDNFVYALAALNILRFLEYPNISVLEMLGKFAEQMTKKAEGKKHNRVIY